MKTGHIKFYIVVFSVFFRLLDVYTIDVRYVLLLTPTPYTNDIFRRNPVDNFKLNSRCIISYVKIGTIPKTYIIDR